jgi:hypothetical protein
MDEETEINIKKANVILAYIFIEINIIIIFITVFMFKSTNKNLRKLKYIFFALIILDSLSFVLYENIVFFLNPFIIDIIFTCLNSIEFYIFISFYYQIFKTTTISKLAKKVDLINPIQLSIFFFFVSFPYHKYSHIFPKIINIVEYIFILCCSTLLYRYFSNTTRTIKNNLLPRDITSAKIFYFLQVLNSICLLLIVCYNVTKFIRILIPETFKIYIEIVLNTINFGLKYYIFLLFIAIIYLLNKNKTGFNADETDRIIFSQVIN